MTLRKVTPLPTFRWDTGEEALDWMLEHDPWFGTLWYVGTAARGGLGSKWCGEKLAGARLWP